MAAPSQFSSAENYAKIQASLEKIDNAIHEAQLAVQAGIPQADTLLKAAEDTKRKIEAFKSVYFPDGTVPASQ